MNKHRHLNRRGKLMVLMLSITALLLFIGLIGGNKNEKADQRVSSIPATPAAQLLSSFAPKKAFANSKLDQSIQSKEDNQEKTIYLTFDDGPTSHTSQLMDTLNQYNAKATFFMLGPNIRSHPSVVKRAVEEGFGIGLHGISHSVEQIYASKSAPLEEMTKDQSILQKITGLETDLVRLPYGSIPYLTVDMRELLNEGGFNIWDWNVDSRDWELKDGSYIKNTIQEIQEVEQRGETPVVLMHDKQETIRYLPELLAYLQQEGYKTKKLTNGIPALTFRCAGRCRALNS
ncbi:polysaccharide deacetylase [Virgibacillus phasianinus]|uniref:Polysaccharide deacetylase n=1 Tax=Virgibacillus phasianinus TaxID=2017483 RepID=A0A220U0X3_9BACI|nr:polysaccharide deacetylase family protein [Virgibacillus phasianinus]ASK61914.1 polysaccharide deacetylase [Virgibacillus phasianinus]